MFIKRVHFHNNLYFWRCRRLQSLKSTHFAFKVPFLLQQDTYAFYVFYTNLHIRQG